MQMRTVCARSCNSLFIISSRKSQAGAAISKAPSHRNFSRPPSQLLQSDNSGSTVAAHNRQKHRQYLGKLLLSPPENITDNVRYYKTVHGQIISSGLASNIFLGNILITAYSREGDLQSAAYLFDGMPERNLISWSSMISGYNQNGYNAEALTSFREFRESGNGYPNEFILSTVIQSCTRLASTVDGLHLHSLVIKFGCDQNSHVGSSLIDFYAKTTDLDAARSVFDELGVKNVVAWTAIITGFSINGRGDVSLNIFKEMVESDILPDKYALSNVLRACSTLELLKVGKQVHAFALRRTGAHMDVSVSNTLIDFYSKCGEPESGRRIFEHMLVKNSVSWATMISCYMQSGLDYEAMNLYKSMNRLELKADGFSCTSVLTSCGCVGDLNLGKQVHAYTVKVNFEYDDFVANSLIDMYCKCDFLTDAKKIFLAAGKYNTMISYNTMIEGYSGNGNLCEAIDLFNQMRDNLIPPSRLTLVSLLGVSSSQSTFIFHSLVIKYGFCSDSYCGSALIDVYSKCSFMESAKLVFEEIDDKDIVVWNSMLFGYALLRSENEDALRLFLELLRVGERPNGFTFVAVIMACSNTASLLHGLQFHCQTLKTGLVEIDPFVTNALMDMYAKCGIIDAANLLFNRAVIRDIACWNSIISTHAHNGDANKALEMFEQMKSEGVIKPDYVTFVGVLSACANGGLVREGFRYFESMIEFGVGPGPEHYACMVSLLGRAGELEEARSFIENMPFEPDALVWKSLLSACRDKGDVELARYAADMAVTCDPSNSGAYVLLSNIFASRGMWIDVKSVRKTMDENGVTKETGFSYVGSR
ncbi:hypothetical protein ABFS82_10G063700 [Erythranthe guttata]|nr:PREDICTED: pentatricopeptide repeat-containing protein At4g39530 [Erythranthe guttata]|eukprot:XP_012828652.1 PREDICTED: pentatricopeptide repeat-containing protein At4g39530 [Erythranthe guttata]